MFAKYKYCVSPFNQHKHVFHKLISCYTKAFHFTLRLLVTPLTIQESVSWASLNLSSDPAIFASCGDLKVTYHDLTTDMKTF